MDELISANTMMMMKNMVTLKAKPEHIHLRARRRLSTADNADYLKESKNFRHLELKHQNHRRSESTSALPPHSATSDEGSSRGEYNPLGQTV